MSEPKTIQELNPDGVVCKGEVFEDRDGIIRRKVSFTCNVLDVSELPYLLQKAEALVRNQEV